MLAIEDVVINATAKQIEDMARRNITNEISEDSTQDELPSAAAVYGFVTTNGGTGGGVASLIVTLDKSTGKASHTAGQILEAREAGQDVIARINGQDIFISMQSVYNTYAVFVVMADDNILEKYLVTDTGDLEYFSEYYVTDTTIGDIASALDKLHSYAQVLIDGGATE